MEESLDRRASLGLLAEGGVGRLLLSCGSLPTIVPVAYRRVRDTVLVAPLVHDPCFATGDGQVVALDAEGPGWTVEVVGVAHLQAGRADQLLVSADLVKGRRLPALTGTG